MRPLALICGAAVLVLAPTAGAQTAPARAATTATPPAPPPAPASAPLSYEQAERVMAAAIAEGRRRNLVLTVSIVEPSGEPVAFVRMTGAGYGFTDIAVAKARTAARFGRETRVLSEIVAAGQLWPLSIQGLIPVEGGVPIVVDGRIAGAIGVSGGSALADGEIARVAQAAAE